MTVTPEHSDAHPGLTAPGHGGHTATAPPVNGAHLDAGVLHPAGGLHAGGLHAAGGLDAGGPDVAAGPNAGGPDATAGPDASGPHATTGPDATGLHAATGPDAGGPHATADPDARGVSSARSAPPAGDGLTPVTGRFLARATLLTAALSVGGAVLGLGRDQALARLFGAGSATDAFLVAWTVPEFAATLLIEDGLAFALIPVFSLALARRAQGGPGDPVRARVAATLPRLTLAFAAVAALVAVAAPQLVAALAPGLPDPRLAVDCTRLTATCVVSFGLAGYCSAALRAHRRFLAPAAIYIAYNTGIIVTMVALGGRWGVRGAAAGVAAGGCLMVVVQLPALWRQVRRRAAPPEASGGPGGPPMALALLAAVLLFALCRQSQVLVERFLASSLPAGAISHLNYAQKVAQIPMTLSLMLCTVTFPLVARAVAEGDTERARARVERDVALAACVVLLGAATVVACAPQIIELLFQRGAFTSRDTAATAGVMRVYALGLLAQTLVGALVRSYFSTSRPSWYPLGAMAAGIVVTAGAGAWAVGPWGVAGIAAANAAGITVTAALLLHGMGPRSVPVRTRRVLAELGRALLAAVAATLAGAFAARHVAAPLPGFAAGAFTVTVVFVLAGRVLGAQGLAPAFRSVRSVTRRLAHGRFR
ncbi:murein biosynthesis integral membrane protein MurJ [Streptomyces sp. DH24]|uniref:murein biosynthesis integral membrane protein MurJ n=1 Tax=Streptomyces sp. DH24 TaxID=3040123 RepID=UPI00244355EF|nr:lipid II flippase MurJ [Streptomyces sp. DH24]MDG9716765.1 lipid II flippase MurJ [Streptomyces sp. DH24]